MASVHLVTKPPPMAPRTVPPPPVTAAGGGPASILSLSENEKRWMVVGICLNKVLLPALHKYIAPKIQNHYALHKTSYNIHSQAHPGFLKKDNNVGFQFNYESINNNRSRLSKKAYDYKVVSAIDFAKLYLRPEMAKFTGFDSTCDASASLGILATSSAFSTPVQNSARDVRSTVRNEWGHCNFDDWEQIQFNVCIQKIDTLIRNLGLSLADETKLLDELKDWEIRGVQLCMGSVVDADLLNLVSGEVAKLLAEVQTAKESNEEESEKVSNELGRMSGLLVECREQASQNKAKLGELSSLVGDLNLNVESLHSGQESLNCEMDGVKESQDKLTQRVEVVEGEHEEIKERVGTLETKIAAGGGHHRDPITFQAPNRNPYFCGREKEMSMLDGPLDESKQTCTLTLISGLGGTGKTSIALEHVWRQKEQYSAGVYWLTGESERDFNITLTEMCRQIGCSGEDLAQTLSNVLDWFQTRKDYWCVVVDNLDASELSEEMMKFLNGSWKRSASGHVIITTRREKALIPADIQDVDEDRCIELITMDEPDSVMFLKKRANREDSDHEDSVITELVQELGCLPLALDQAGAYIYQRKCSFTEYLQQFKKKRLLLMKRISAHYISSKERTSVYTTWQLNFDYVKKQSEELDIGNAASLIMNVSTFLSPDDIPVEIINEGLPKIDDEDLKEATASAISVSELLELLTNFSLFRKFSDHSYSVHRVVQEVIRSRVKDDDKKVALSSAVRMLNFAFSKARNPKEVCESFMGDAVFAEDKPPSLHLWAKLARHACSLQDHIIFFVEKERGSSKDVMYTEETAKLFYEASVFLNVCREKVKAQDLQRLKLEVLSSLPNSPSEETMAYLNHFKVPLQNKQYKLISHCIVPKCEQEGYSSVASDLQKKANDFREKGNDAVKRGEFQEALDWYTKGIELTKTDHRLFSNRALCHLKINKPKEALADCESCLKLEEHFGKALQRKAWALHELSRLHPGDKHRRGRFLCAAALAQYYDLTFRESPVFKNMSSHIVEVKDASELVSQIENNTTILLHEGSYELRHGIVMISADVQIVGIGRVSITLHETWVVFGANCCIENVTVAKGSEAIVCRMGSLTMLECNISAGRHGCKDFPYCDGGPGCIADMGNPCRITDPLGAQMSKASGRTGNPGIQIFDQSSAVLKYCSVFDCGGGGALCHGSGSAMSVISCRVYKNQQMGLEAREGARLTVTDCDIFANNFHGVLLGPYANASEIVNNRIFENHGEGILVRLSNELSKISSNRIYHNRPFGISLDCANVCVFHNEIFENGFWGIIAKTKTSASIQNNELYSNKCGGIFIGLNFSGRISIESNTVRNHIGPWLYFGENIDLSKTKADDLDDGKNFYLPPGETRFYTTPPIVGSNTLKNNGEETMFHPKEQAMPVTQHCAFCHRTGKLKTCSNCRVASYCDQTCQKMHLAKHKLLCKSVTGLYSVTATISTLFFGESKRGIREFGSHLKGLGEGPKLDPRSSRRFIVKVQTQNLNSHPRQLLTVYDKSLSIDCQIECPEIFHVIMECGVLGQLYLFTSKKVFLWAKFAAKGKKLTFYLDHLAPYQEW
ncbi:uncharacterized protein LOC116603637 [Nematostella vectensis]|uniref:uncharacterized protein LOC116603637 n=1 Tax=Nematostella vectensis TaxID=45351 RepID=UPI0020779A7C|nr:uncharacterized protein LOC116603637 [Nematostella vectensis]XP_048575961.1 uncharacterized protein LOC116603637 [Nematostella vectensis]